VLKVDQREIALTEWRDDMGRVKKGVLMLREYLNGKSMIFGEDFGDRYDLIDWLNRASKGPSRDRKAADRVGTVIRGMNEAAVKFSRSWNQYMDWRLSGTEEASWGSPAPKSLRIYLNSMRGISPRYKLEFDLSPSFDGDKWKITFHCSAPSGKGTEIKARWDGESDENPESQAIETVVVIALDGRLGTIRQCEVGACGKWFLTKADSRIRCCPEHNVDDLRSGTEERKKQNKEAAKRARDRQRDEDERQWIGSREAGFAGPGRRRAKFKTDRP
jgi:hypothetical protein